MDILGVAQQGLQQAQGQFEQTVQRFTQAVTAGESQAPTDSVNISDAAVSLLSVKDQYQTDLGVAHVADKMQQATLNLVR
jgi:hypothetical protein